MYQFLLENFPLFLEEQEPVDLLSFLLTPQMLSAVLLPISTLFCLLNSLRGLAI